MPLALTNGPQFRYTLRSPLLPTQRLADDPVGWDAVGIALTRDTSTHGVTTEYSGQLSFVKAGRAYVARAYQAAGIGAEVSVDIEQLDPNAFAWQPYYAGRVNYAGAEFSQTAAKVNVEQQSFLQQFLARTSVKVDVLGNSTVSGAASPAPTPLTVELHSRAITKRYAAQQKAAAALAPGLMSGSDDDASHEQLLYFGFDTPVLNELGLGAVGGGFVAGSVGEAAPIFTDTGSGSLTLELALFFHVEAHATPPTNLLNYRQFRQVDAVFHLRVKTATSDTITELRPPLSQKGLLGDYVADEAIAPLTRLISWDNGVSIYLYADYYVHALDFTSVNPYQAKLEATMLPGSYLRLTAITQTAPTTTQGVLLYEAFERVAQALSEQVDVFRSDFFGRTDRGYPVDGPGAATLLTGGFQVRGFPLLTDAGPADGATDTRKSLYTSWEDLFGAGQAAWGLGYGLEWATGRSGKLVRVLRVEPQAYWYPAGVVVDLTAAGPVTDTTTVAEADHYQIAEIGYRDWQAEQANGLDEFNSTRQYTTPLTVVSNTYSQLSPISASGVLLETTRRNRYDATATADTSQDATNFFVCLLRVTGGYVTERNQLATQLTGVLSPETVYNLRLSPGRLLLRHGALLRAGLLASRGYVRFTSGTGNTTMTSQLAGEPAAIAEGSDVAVASLPAPLWRPEQVRFTAPMGREQLRALLAAPTGRVRYLDTASTAREGWVVDFKHQAAAESGEFTLRPCAV